MKIFNSKAQKQLRKTLRNDMPKAEIVLWSQINNKQLKDCKFRRQCSIGKFVVDFYAPQYKLAIEIDGDSHFETDEVENYDQNRQKFIESLGIKILRFTNNDIYESLDHVLEVIEASIQNLPQPLAFPRRG